MRNSVVINLITIRENARKIRQKLEPNCKFCAVVKADAYGHGAIEVASAIYSVVDCYAVALLEEGKQLRLGGIDKDILVLIPPFRSDIEDIVKLSLTATVDDFKTLRLLDEEGKRQGKIVKVHIKYNTGMNRNGVDGIDNLKRLLGVAKSLKHVEIEGLYSHFGAVENKRIREYALKEFLLANKVLKGYNNRAISHISASGGFLVGGMNFDMVRIGLLLYGYIPNGIKTDFAVTPALELEVPVVKVRKVDARQRVCYGTKQIKKSKKISLIRLGYADGLERRRIKGQVSSRCMDLTAIEGDYKTYKIENVKDLAKKYKTIPYEILTKIAIRADKKYKR